MTKQGQSSKRRKSRDVAHNLGRDRREAGKRTTVAKGGRNKSKVDGNGYPEAAPMPQVRLPHLIEPIRAELVQTERVVESPEDPPPNAYYDAQNNVLRVYHGPVYGACGNYSLYPRRDASAWPLHVGRPHPLHNPYLGGFRETPPRPFNGPPHHINMPAWPGATVGTQKGMQNDLVSC